MSARTNFIYLTAAWREAARARDPYIDLDHLLIGLIAVGGPAAQLLTRHGLDLTSARTAACAVQADSVALLGVNADALPEPTPRPMNELNHDHVGDVPMSERLSEFVNRTWRRASERDILRALLADKSGMIRNLVERAGADPKAVMTDVNKATDWITPMPRRARAVESQAHEPTAAVQLRHFVAADARLVRSVAVDPALAPQWLMLPDMKQHENGILVGSRATRRRTGALRLALTVDDEDRVRWSDRWDGRLIGWYDLQLTPAEAGAVVTLTRAVRSIGLLGSALSPWSRLTNGLGLLVRVQNLSFACADASAEQAG